MYQFSRALYRELAPYVETSRCPVASRREVLAACEATMHRLATDRRYFARPARRMFADIRHCFPLDAHARALRLIVLYIGAAEAYLDEVRLTDDGQPKQCPVSTRRGTPCRREPVANGYCPSHQHLVGTAGREPVAA